VSNQTMHVSCYCRQVEQITANSYLNLEGKIFGKRHRLNGDQERDRNSGAQVQNTAHFK